MNKSGGSRRSQATILIIVGIVIVAAIILVFVLNNFGYIKLPKISKQNLPPAQEYIGACATDATQQAVDIMLPQGGYINPSNYVTYDGVKVAYLCYSYNYYLQCVNQEPMYIEHLEGEIKGAISDKVDECFNDLKSNYEKQKYNVVMDDKKRMNIDLKLKPGKIDIIIKRHFQVEKNDESIKIDEFTSFLAAPVYDLGRAAIEIMNQEGSYCNFASNGFSLLYPELLVYYKQPEYGTNVYTIEHKKTGTKLLLATRSCVVPQGR